jgi:hypothetical protein
MLKAEHVKKKVRAISEIVISESVVPPQIVGPHQRLNITIGEKPTNTKKERESLPSQAT